MNIIPEVSKLDLETPERVWSAHNGLSNSTKTQGPRDHHDVLDDHFGFWNWLKYISLGKTLMTT
jgi:Kyakuja-Dileera-Zisupton transposase